MIKTAESLEAVHTHTHTHTHTHNIYTNICDILNLNVEKSRKLDFINYAIKIKRIDKKDRLYTTKIVCPFCVHEYT